LQRSQPIPRAGGVLYVEEDDVKIFNNPSLILLLSLGLSSCRTLYKSGKDSDLTGVEESYDPVALVASRDEGCLSKVNDDLIIQVMRSHSEVKGLFSLRIQSIAVFLQGQFKLSGEQRRRLEEMTKDPSVLSDEAAAKDAAEMLTRVFVESFPASFKTVATVDFQKFSKAITVTISHPIHVGDLALYRAWLEKNYPAFHAMKDEVTSVEINAIRDESTGHVQIPLMLSASVTRYKQKDPSEDPYRIKFQTRDARIVGSTFEERSELTVCQLRTGKKSPGKEKVVSVPVDLPTTSDDK